MVILYSKKDMIIMEDSIDNIIDNARRVTLKTLEPTLDEYNKVMKIILKYIKINKRVIYGGYAWNQLIIKKNPADRIYSKDNIEQADVEFYSPEPIIDLVNLCDELHGKEFKFVRGESAQHDETYTIYVNQLGYCDISYMPKFLSYKMPTLKINDILLADPKFILIDILRQYNDPMTSYWRVKKNLIRANTLLSHYPLQTNGKFIKHKIDESCQRILNFVRKEIIIGSKLLVFGYYAYQYYIYKSNDSKKEELYVPYYDVISTNLSEDARSAYEKLIAFNENITVEEYHPFFQFNDRCISFLHNGKIMFNIYGSNQKCIPSYHIPKKDIYVVTFPYMIQTFIINQLYHSINKNNNEASTLDFLLENIIKKRNEFLKNNNKTILDNTPFQEFRIECQGETMAPDRKFRLSIAEKIKKRQRIKFRYDPSARNDNFKPEIYKFSNSSGNINNTQDKILINSSGNKNNTQDKILINSSGNKNNTQNKILK